MTHRIELRLTLFIPYPLSLNFTHPHNQNILKTSPITPAVIPACACALFDLRTRPIPQATPTTFSCLCASRRRSSDDGQQVFVPLIVSFTRCCASCVSLCFSFHSRLALVWRHAVRYVIEKMTNWLLRFLYIVGFRREKNWWVWRLLFD